MRWSDTSRCEHKVVRGREQPHLLSNDINNVRYGGYLCIGVGGWEGTVYSALDVSQSRIHEAHSHTTGNCNWLGSIFLVTVTKSIEVPFNEAMLNGS